jgi:hypothetical protein
MSNNKKTIILVLTFIGFSLLNVTVFAAEANYVFPCPNLPLTEACPSVAEATVSPAAYIARFYQFALGIAGLLAFVMIIVGAIQYIVSAGSPAAQKDARDRIFQAFWGVALLLGAWLILHTIDPKLVNLTDPNLSLTSCEILAENKNKNAIGGGYAKYQWAQAIRREEGGYFSYICPDGGVEVDEHWCGGTAKDAFTFCCASGGRQETNISRPAQTCRSDNDCRPGLVCHGASANTNGTCIGTISASRPWWRRLW